MESDESWRSKLALTRQGSLAQRDPHSVALYLMNHDQLKDRADLKPQFVRLIMHTDHCKAPMSLIEPMLVMHLAHLNKSS